LLVGDWTPKEFPFGLRGICEPFPTTGNFGPRVIAVSFSQPLSIWPLWFPFQQIYREFFLKLFSFSITDPFFFSLAFFFVYDVFPPFSREVAVFPSTVPFPTDLRPFTLYHSLLRNPVRQVHLPPPLVPPNPAFLSPTLSLSPFLRPPQSFFGFRVKLR